MHVMGKSPLKPRLVLYGTGQFGQRIARLAVEKNWPIVAAYNRAGPKVGQDLGRLAGLGRDLGVIVQDCETASYDVEADIALVTATNSLRQNMPAYKRLIGAGLNILCLAGQAYYPYGNEPELAAEIDAMAKKANVTFTGSGIWDTSRIWSGILVAGACTEIKSLAHRSITDISRQIVSQEQARELAVGIPAKEFYEKGYGDALISLLYKTIPEHVLAAIGYTDIKSTVRLEPVVFDEPVSLALFDKPIPPGDCVGTRIVCESVAREGVKATAEIELRLFKPGEVEHMVWTVDGMPKTQIRTERNDSAHASAASLFNRIPDVIAAQPGIVLVSQMGPLKHTALV
jgi:4-hydroxy-tetrahydrodipicolinate reductase